MKSFLLLKNLKKKPKNKIRKKPKVYGLNNLTKPLLSSIKFSIKKIIKTGERSKKPGFENQGTKKIDEKNENISTFKNSFSKSLAMKKDTIIDIEKYKSNTI